MRHEYLFYIFLEICQGKIWGVQESTVKRAMNRNVSVPYFKDEILLFCCFGSGVKMQILRCEEGQRRR